MYTVAGGGWGGLLNKVLYGEAPPEVQTLTFNVLIFYQNGTPFIYLEKNCIPFSYLKVKPKQ